MKQECPTYLKTIGKSKALATTLSDTKLRDDSDNEDNGILNAFTATVNPTEGLLKMGMMMKTWWILSSRKWTIKIIYIYIYIYIFFFSICLVREGNMAKAHRVEKFYRPICLSL